MGDTGRSTATPSMSLAKTSAPTALTKSASAATRGESPRTANATRASTGRRTRAWSSPSGYLTIVRSPTRQPRRTTCVPATHCRRSARRRATPGISRRRFPPPTRRPGPPTSISTRRGSVAPKSTAPACATVHPSNFCAHRAFPQSPSHASGGRARPGDSRRYTPTATPASDPPHANKYTNRPAMSPTKPAHAASNEAERPHGRTISRARAIIPQHG